MCPVLSCQNAKGVVELDNKNSTMNWHRIMKAVSEEDLAREEAAYQRYRSSLQLCDSEKLQWAASDIPEMESIRHHIGAEFAERCPINLKIYSAELYVLDQNSALLIFRKGDGMASDLNGKKIDFYLKDKPSKFFSEAIQDEEVVVDFQKLGISIQNYSKVAFKLYLDESTVIEESLGNEKT